MGSKSSILDTISKIETKQEETINNKESSPDKIFISYTHSDKDIVHRVVSKLEERTSIWIDRDKIKEGDELTKKIEKGIHESSIVICFISKKYSLSPNCRLEFFFAHNLKKKCLYVVLERIKSEDVTGMTIYLYGEFIRFDAFKVFKQNLDEYANLIYLKLMNLIDGQNQTDLPVLEQEENIFSTRDDYFIGRDEIFTEIGGGKKIKILFGLPGVGKTSIAREYAYRVLDDQTFDEVYWFNADAEFKINEALYNYGSNQRENKQSDGRSDIIQRFLSNLRGQDKVLLIFDNVENLKDVTNTVNISQMKCITLMTTKNEKTIPNYATRIDVKPFGEIEMKVFLKSKLPSLKEKQLDKLSQQLQIKNEYLPYKLSMISTILIDDPTTNVDELFQSNYYESNTFLKNILNKISKKNSQAYKLLQYLVLLDPDYIPGNLFEKLIPENNDKKLIMQILLSQNLCDIVAPNTPQYGLRVHRLLQTDLESYFNLTNQEIHNMERDLLKVINELFIEVNQYPDRTWKKAGLYYPHALKIITKKQMKVDSEILKKMSIYEGCVLMQYNSAIVYAEQALKNWEDENKSKSDILIWLGIFYSDLGDTKKALEYYTMALDLYKQLFQGDHPDIASSYNNIGNEYSNLGDTKKALEYYMMALEIYKKLFQGDHPTIASLYNNIGEVISNLGDTKKALEYIIMAMDMRKRLFQGDHPDIAMSYNNIGKEYSNLGDTKKALEYYMMSLDMYKHLYQGDHPEIASSYNNIGNEYSNLGDTKKALEYYTMGLEIYKQLFQGDHPKIAFLYNNIGIAYSNLEDKKKALEYIIMAMEMRKRLFQGDHPDIASSYINVGNEYSNLEDTEKALDYYMMALEIYKQLFQGDHPDVAMTYNNIGKTYSNMEDTEKALEYYTMALEMYKQLFHGDHPNIAFLYNNIGNEYSNLEDTEKALEYYMMALDMYKQLFQGDHPDVAMTYNNIGDEYSNLENGEKALEYFMMALEMFKHLYNEDHPDVAMTYNNIGDEYSNLENAEKALEYYMMALEIYKHLYHGDHPEIATSYSNIGNEYSNLGDTKKALEYEKMAMEMRKQLF